MLRMQICCSSTARDLLHAAIVPSWYAFTQAGIRRSYPLSVQSFPNEVMFTSSKAMVAFGGVRLFTSGPL